MGCGSSSVSVDSLGEFREFKASCKVPDVSLSHDARTMTFRVILPKQEGVPMGALLKDVDEGVIFVSISATGCVQKWNSENPAAALRLGDRIVSANGISGGVYDIAAELWKTGKIELEIERKLDAQQSIEVEHEGGTHLAQYAHWTTRMPLRCPVDSLPHCSAGECGATECAICFEDYNDPVTRVVTLPCNHAFHPVCVARWFCQERCCPLCKKAVGEAELLETI